VDYSTSDDSNIVRNSIIFVNNIMVKMILQKLYVQTDSLPNYSYERILRVNLTSAYPVPDLPLMPSLFSPALPAVL
jgi:hypothetical protein